MFEGDLNQGELEIGQVSGIINDIKTSKEIITTLVNEYTTAKNSICND